MKLLQRVLGGVAVEGAYDRGTEVGVRGFQRTNDLPETGIVDEKTWDALKEEARTHR